MKAKLESAVGIGQLLGFGIGLTLSVHSDGSNLLLLNGTVLHANLGSRNSINNVHTGSYLTKCSILAIQVLCILVHNKELRASRVGAGRTSHGQNATLVLQIILNTVKEELALDAVTGATHTSTVGAATLDHETTDDTMENQAIIIVMICQVDKVVNALRCYIGVQFTLNDAAINADDYYGKTALKKIYTFLETAQDNDKYAYCMVAYNMGNTVTENGYVSRGVCQTDAEGFLTCVTERTQIEQYEGGIHYIGDDGESWVDVAADTPVSMNMWGFTGSFMAELRDYFPVFLTQEMPKNPEKAEMFLPSMVSLLINRDKATVKVLRTDDKWYGVTYAADKPTVIAALQALTAQGLYPDGLWG